MLGFNNERVAAYNRQLFLFNLFRLKDASVSDLAALLGLSVQAVSRIARDLQQEGRIELHDSPATGKRGHSAGLIRFSHADGYIVCLDVRPTAIFSVLCDFFGSVKEGLKVRPIVMQSKDKLLSDLVQEIRHYQQLHPRAPLRVAIALHGQVDAQKGVSLLMPQSPWHEPMYVKFLLEKELGLEVLLDNDCVMRALAQKWYLLRHNEDITDYCVINLDYGIGSSFLINNEVYRGALFGSGQIGHTIIDPEGRLCSCGRHGCLETFASNKAVLREVKLALRALGGREQVQTFEDVVVLYHEGNEVVRSQVNKAARAIGLAIYNFLNVININHIFLYGSSCQFGEEFLDAIIRMVVSNPFDREAQVKSQSTSIVYGTLSVSEQIAGISYLFGEQLSRL